METFLIVVLAFLGGAGFGWWRRLAAETTGERAVRHRLMDEFGSQGAHLLNNVTIPCEAGTTQVDHILLSRRGVFVIESKHYTGCIFASDKSAKWTQVIYKVKNTFQNPLRQNYKHSTEVRKILEFLPSDLVHSAVVFTGDAEFKTAIPNGVFGLDGLVGHIRSFRDDSLSENRVQFCVGRLECKRLALTGATDVEHQAHLTNRFRN